MKFTLEGVQPSLNGPFQVSMTSGGELLEEVVRKIGRGEEYHRLRGRG